MKNCSRCRGWPAWSYNALLEVLYVLRGLIFSYVYLWALIHVTVVLRFLHNISLDMDLSDLLILALVLSTLLFCCVWKATTAQEELPVLV